MGLVFAVIAAVSFACSTLFVQRGMRKASASAGVMVNIAASNVVFGTSLLAILIAGAPITWSWAGALFAAASGVAGNVMGRTFNFMAIRRIGSGRTTSFALTQTLFALIWGILLLDELLSGYSLMGIVLIVGGVYWLSQERNRKDETAATAAQPNVLLRRRVIQGVTFALLSGLAFSMADLLRKLGVREMPSAVMTAAIGGLVALIVQSLVYTFQGGWKELRGLDRKTWVNLILSGFFAGTAVISVFSALSVTPIAIVNALYSVRVWFTIVMGPVLVGKEERVTGVLVGSTILILAGALIITFSR